MVETIRQKILTVYQYITNWLITISKLSICRLFGIDCYTTKVLWCWRRFTFLRATTKIKITKIVLILAVSHILKLKAYPQKVTVTQAWENRTLLRSTAVMFTLFLQARCVCHFTMVPQARQLWQRRQKFRLRRDGWAGRSVWGVWREGGKGKEGRREGVSQHAAPLGRQAITSKALPSLCSLLRSILLK